MKKLNSVKIGIYLVVILVNITLINFWWFVYRDVIIHGDVDIVLPFYSSIFQSIGPIHPLLLIMIGLTFVIISFAPSMWAIAKLIKIAFHITNKKRDENTITNKLSVKKLIKIIENCKKDEDILLLSLKDY